jgi:hypothetical protein
VADDVPLDLLLADAADALVGDFDPAEGRRRLESVLRAQRDRVLVVLWISPVMLASLVFLGPWLMSFAGREVSRGSLVLPFIGPLGMVAVLAGWWWWSRRRVARALAAGPPAMRRVADALGREAGNGRRLLAVCGLIGGPALLLVAWENAGDGGAWWWVAWLGALGLWITIGSLRDGIRLVREDRRRGRAAGDGATS